MGDSFFVPVFDADPNAVMSAVCRFRKKHKAFKFTTERGETGIRVWRIK